MLRVIARGKFHKNLIVLGIFPLGGRFFLSRSSQIILALFKNDQKLNKKPTSVFSTESKEQ